MIHSNKLLTEFELQAIQQSVSADAAADAKGADTIIGYALCNPVKPDELLDEIVSPKKFDPVRVNVSFDGTAPNETASPKCDPVRLNVSSDGTVPIFDYVLSDDVVSPATVLTTSPAVGAVNVAAREFDSVLSCARHCFSKATPEMARMFEQVITFLQDFDTTCFSSRTPVSRVAETKTVKNLIHLANQCISEILMTMELDMLECNCLVYAAAKAVVYIAKGNSSNSFGGHNSGEHWKERLTSRISKLRKDLSQLVAINSCTTLTPRLFAIKKRLYKAYKSNSVHSFLIATETLKQKITCSAVRLKKYKEKVTRFRQNTLFRSNQRKFYRQLKQCSDDIIGQPSLPDLTSF